jgi:hypothetical protein
MPAGEPVLGSGLGDRQLLGDNFENSNASTGHPRTLAPSPDTIPAIAAPAQPYGLSLHHDRRQTLNPSPNQVRPMSRLTSDLSPETYLLNPDTPLIRFWKLGRGL